MIKLGENLKNKIALSNLFIALETAINVDFNDVSSSKTWDYLYESLNEKSSDSIDTYISGVKNEID